MPDVLPRYKQPSRLATMMEVRAPFDWATLLFRAPQLASAPRGDGRPIMLIPGYRSDAMSLRPLCRYLEYLGYAAYDWGQGRNRGDVEGDIRRVGQRAREIHDSLDDQPVTLIGWSIGGVAAREAARLFEPVVREVITLGTPVVGGPKYTVLADRFSKSANLDLEKLEKEIHERNLIGIRQPVSSIYSRTDGIVGWQASVDRYNKHANNIEVTSSHFGLGINAQVWRVIAQLLAG